MVENEFKNMFKYYKRKNPPPNFENVLDPDKEMFKNDFEEIYINQDYVFDGSPSVNCNPRVEWRIYKAKHNPGFIIISNVFNKDHQFYWIRQCLTKYSSSEYRRNIDAHDKSVDNWFTQARNNTEITDKLRWSTLGYHHNWDTKEYDELNKDEFPQDLADLSKYIANSLGHNSGCVAVMTEESRLCYHAIPRIIIQPDNIHQILPTEIIEKCTSLKDDSKRTNTNDLKVISHCDKELLKTKGNENLKCDIIMNKDSYSDNMALSDNETNTNSSIDTGKNSKQDSSNNSLIESNSEIVTVENDIIAETNTIDNYSEINDISNVTSLEEKQFILRYLESHRINLNIRQVNIL